MFFYWLLAACYLPAYGQLDFNLLIEVEGTDVENIYLDIALDSSYYESIYDFEQSRTDSKDFLFKGQLDYPYLYELKIDSFYFTDSFVVYPGMNRIKLKKVGNDYKILRLDEHSQDQNLIVYRSWFENDYSVYDFLRPFDQSETLGEKRLSDIRDSLLVASYDRTDSVLYLFTKDNPQSYYSLWYVNRLLRFGYTPLMRDIFELYDSDLKGSYLGKLTQQLLENKEKLKVGTVIPNGVFEGINRKELDLHAALANHRLTMINFWYSDCSPCLAKIPYLKKLLAQYEKKGFGIIHISTDSEKDIPKWRKTIQKHSISWLNLLDVSKSHSSVYGVEVFPFSFLVDSKGIILKVNPTNADLEELLELY